MDSKKHDHYNLMIFVSKIHHALLRVVIKLAVRQNRRTFCKSGTDLAADDAGDMTLQRIIGSLWHNRHTKSHDTNVPKSFLSITN